MNLDFPEFENKILQFWQGKKIFEKLQEKIKNGKKWSFLDGPITANNPMGVHHAWGRTYKDLFRRYKAMNGFQERYQNGFDCQGLWVEVEVEKELGFKSKKDIEEYGIEKFVQKCKERVRKFSAIQTKQSIRLGQWMDWQNSYYTMSEENNYAIWAFLKKAYQKGLVYKGKDVVPWCPRCGTAISQHEILTEEYKELTHKSIYLKFRVLEGGNSKLSDLIRQGKLFFLAWTTTPWTLPANVALAVNLGFNYIAIKKDNEAYILLEEKKDLVEGGEIVEKIKGAEMEGWQYEGIFDELEEAKKNLANYKHRVILWDEISQEEGTGIVHIAPGCGEEDFQLSKEYNIPVIDPTNDQSEYKEGFGKLSGLPVYKEETKEIIFKSLQEKGLVFKIEDYKHRYPTCWRCKSELIFRLVDEWYIKMDPLRDGLIESVKKVNWIPSFGLEREIDWLKNMKDWLISKKRYWGLALPIYECPKCGCFEVIGSKEELKEKAISGWDEFEGHTPHRPWIDKVKIKCPKCGAEMSRVPDVGNPWLDAGIVPFSTMGYFRDKDYWQKWFPADLICESFPGQFKNWFYSLLVMSQVLENEPPFKTVFGYGTVVDEKGEEMHKSKGNAIWFDEAVEKIGADVMRWLYARQNPAYNLRFGYNVANEIRRKLMTLWNSYVFFETYALKNKLNGDDGFDFSNDNILDKWIASKLNRTIKAVSESFEVYNPAKSVSSLEDFFINDLSLWYIRRSRKIFQSPEDSKEKEIASRNLFYILLTLTKLIAPIIPFFAEFVYQKIKTDDIPESIHLNDWSKVNESLIDNNLEKAMDEIRGLATKALSLRNEAGIKVRQPLKALRVKSEELSKLKSSNEDDYKKLIELLKEEVNIKEVVLDEKMTGDVELDKEITPELKEEGAVREVIRVIQGLRKEEGLTPKDKIKLYYSAGKFLDEIVEKNRDKILADTRSLSVEKKEETNLTKKKEAKIFGKTTYFSIEKI